MLVGGIVLSFLTPVYQVPDEIAHFSRAWQVSEGFFLSPAQEREDGKSNLISSVPSVFFHEKITAGLASKKYSFSDISGFLSTPLENDKRTIQRINASGEYAPVLYFPQALGAYIVRILGGSAGQIYYAMRIAAVLFVALCIFWSIRVLPEKGLLIFLLAMMPMFLAESASIAADAVLYGVCIFVSAYILSLASDGSEEKLTAGQIFMLLFMSAVVGLLKQIYGTIMLLYFLIPSKKMKSLKNYLALGCVLLLVCLFSSFAWIYMSTLQYNAAMAINKHISGVDAIEQAKFLVHNPVRGIFVFVKSNILSAKFFASSFVGTLGWLTLKLPMWFYFLYAVLIIIGSLYGKLNLSLAHRIIMLIGFLATLLALDVYMYLTWTPVAEGQVAGIQGRYFIPAAMMLFAALSYFPRMKHEKTFAVIAGTLSLIMTLGSTFSFFYL